jgi:hypothetical protein
MHTATGERLEGPPAPYVADDGSRHCGRCNGSGAVAVGPWGVRPPKVACPACAGRWTRG